MTDPATHGRRYGGKTAAERLADRRTRLLDAGLQLFGTVGYAATTIEMLCARTRLNPRYFYEQFASREDLLAAVYDRHVEAVAALVSEAIEDTTPEPRARLEAGVRAFLDGVLADPRAARINYFEVVGVSPALERRRRAVLRAYGEMVAGQLTATAGDRLPPGLEARRVAVAFVGATDGLIIDWLSGERRTDREGIINTLLALLDPLLER